MVMTMIMTVLADVSLIVINRRVLARAAVKEPVTVIFS